MLPILESDSLKLMAGYTGRQGLPAIFSCEAVRLRRDALALMLWKVMLNTGPLPSLISFPHARMPRSQILAWMSLRRTNRTFPGMLLRFPGLGMPLAPTPPTEPKRPYTKATAGTNERSTQGSAAASPTASRKKDTYLPGEASEVAEEGALGHYRVGGGAATDREPAFGDLIVKAAIMLPSGKRLLLNKLD